MVFTAKMFEKHLWKSAILSKDAGQNQFYLMEPEVHQISLWYIKKISGYV